MDLDKIINNIHWLGHASFYIGDSNSLIIYLDPYNVKDNLPKADIILISHEHFDHCSVNDVRKILKGTTTIVGPSTITGKFISPIKILKPKEKLSISAVVIEAVYAYNINKNFHPKSDINLGFVVKIDGVSIYHAGDTDSIPEMKNLKVDIAILPIGGVYTMNAKEAAQAADVINPRIAIPMHYGSIVGSSRDLEDFKKFSNVEVKVLEKE